jgi:hypothetical protein
VLRSVAQHLDAFRHVECQRDGLGTAAAVVLQQRGHLERTPGALNARRAAEELDSQLGRPGGLGRQHDRLDPYLGSRQVARLDAQQHDRVLPPPKGRHVQMVGMHLAIGTKRKFHRVVARLSGVDAEYASSLARLDSHPDRQEGQFIGRDIQRRADQPRLATAGFEP